MGDVIPILGSKAIEAAARNPAQLGCVFDSDERWPALQSCVAHTTRNEPLTSWSGESRCPRIRSVESYTALRSDEIDIARPPRPTKSGPLGLRVVPRYSRKSAAVASVIAMD